MSVREDKLSKIVFDKTVRVTTGKEKKATTTRVAHKNGAGDGFFKKIFFDSINKATLYVIRSYYYYYTADDSLTTVVKIKYVSFSYISCFLFFFF